MKTGTAAEGKGVPLTEKERRRRHEEMRQREMIKQRYELALAQKKREIAEGEKMEKGVKEEDVDKDERIVSLEEDKAILTDTLDGISDFLKANKSDVNCEDVLAHFTKGRCSDLNEVRKFVLCTATRVRDDRKISIDKAIKQAWIEARDRCRSWGA